MNNANKKDENNKTPSEQSSEKKSEKTSSEQLVDRSVSAIKKIGSMLKSYGNQFFDAVQKPYRQSAQSIHNLEERVKQQFSKKPKNPIDTHSFWSFWIIGLVIV